MANDSDAEGPAVCCLPGDITVTKIHTGYLIGRALEPIGPGPWWEYVAIVSTLAEATHHARTIAREYDVRAWLHRNGDDYELIPRES